MKDAPVVLLDEVTSALDPVNEAAGHEGIERLMAGRPVVMVAHRLRMIQRADHIVFLADGRITERGTQEELLRHDGRYADYWHLSTAPDQVARSALVLPAESGEAPTGLPHGTRRHAHAQPPGKR